jgi:hypothetical protein
MLLLQTILQQNQGKSLDEYVEQLENKLNAKGKLKQIQQTSIEGNLPTVGKISAIKTCRHAMWDGDKENKLNVTNIQVNVCDQSRKKYESSLNITGEAYKLTKMSSL